MKESAYAILRENVDAHWWNTSKDRILSELIKSLVIPLDGNILELGVGTGNFLFNLKFLNKFGVDLYIYKDNYYYKGFTFIQADINIPPFKERTIDLLLLIDVLEHIRDDRGLVENCLKILRKNGKLVIFTPAQTVLWSDLDEMNEHLRRYTAKDLNKLLADIGIEHKIIKSSYINFFLYPYIFVVRMTQKLLKKAIKGYDSSAFRMPNKVINIIFKFIFSSERFFLKFLNFPMGVSYLCIIEKV